MMKKVLLSLAAVALVLSASAQINTRVVSIGPSVGKHTEARKVAKIASNQHWVGLYSSDDLNENGIGVPDFPGDNRIGAYLSSDLMSGYVGKKIVGMRFGLCASQTNSRVFINKASGPLADVSIGDELFGQDVASAKVGWNEVMLSQPIDITDGEGYLVGYNFKQGNTRAGNYYTLDCYPISAVKEGDDLDNKLWIYCNIPTSQGGDGVSWYPFSGQNGNLSVQLLIEGDFANYDVSLKDFSEAMGVVNTNADVTLSFYNNSKEAVSDLDCVVTVDGMDLDEQHIAMANAVAVGKNGEITVSVPCGSEVKNREVAVKVTKVNGNANQSQNATAKGTLRVVPKMFNRGVVVEEFTGTGCGWCPRGLVGMEKAAAHYPDNFIGIAIHKFNASDPMFASDYANVGLSSAPSCVINRNGRAIDPYYGSNKSILDDMAAAVKDVPMIGVDVNGVWNADSTVVTVNANIDSYVSGKYEIAYVLTADNLTANKSSWRQSNYYTNFTKQQLIDQGEEDLAIFAKDGDKGSKYFNWEFMDVLIGSSYSNTSNLAAPVTLTANETNTTSYDVAMPTKAALKNALKATGRKVAVIAIVIDQQTGQVVNAGKSYNIVSNTTGIQGVVDNAKYYAVEVARYNASGQRIKAPVMGINIIKMSDGRTVKVIVK